MEYLFTYYLIGLLVSIYFIYYYRLSNKTKSQPKQTDALEALVGPWVWPVQIIVHIVKIVKNDNKNHDVEKMKKFPTILLAFSICYWVFMTLPAFIQSRYTDPFYWLLIAVWFLFWITIGYIFRVRLMNWIFKK